MHSYQFSRINASLQWPLSMNTNIKNLSPLSGNSWQFELRVPSYLGDVPCGVTKSHHPCAPLLNSAYPMMHVVSCDSLACNLPLKHLLNVVLVVFMPQL
jgi:hypothetical protein